MVQSEEPHHFELPLTSGGRIVGMISGVIEVDENGAVVTDDSDNIMQQLESDASLYNPTMGLMAGLPPGVGVGM